MMPKEFSSVVFSDIASSGLQEILLNEFSSSKIAILTDTNSYEYCLPHLFNFISGLEHAEIIQVDPGEDSKSIEIAHHILSSLSEFGFGKKDLLINLGGGVVSDLGGFIAAVYKRGIPCINIPTSLLGMVDAAIGGKTGVNLDDYKNQIGTITFPIMTIVDSTFLDTLNSEERLNGFAEMLKHGLISDAALFQELVTTGPDGVTSSQIKKSAAIKLEIVEQDPYEKGLRKLLNFGHTFGHALEGALFSQNAISHGHAVAIGMLVESAISNERGLLNSDAFLQVENVIKKYFRIPRIDEGTLMRILDLLKNDKKNDGKTIRTCLLSDIGTGIFDQIVSQEEFKVAFERVRFYS